MARVVIVSSGHLCTNPRVWREADALATAGHDVTVTGVWLDSTHAEWDRALLADRPWSFVPAADLRGHSPRSAVARLRARARSKVGRIRVHAGLGDDPHALGYAVDRLERTAFRLTPDLVVCHLEPGLWVPKASALRALAIASGEPVSVTVPAPEPPQAVKAPGFVPNLKDFQAALTAAIESETTERVNHALGRLGD